MDALPSRVAVTRDNADAIHHELISHLGRTHLLVEPFCVATKRVLSSTHPISVFLWPHLEDTILINFGAVNKLVMPGGKVDLLLGGTIESELGVAAGVARKKFTERFLPTEISRRGVGSKAMLYPYRDDGIRVWNAIHAYTTEYIALYYKTDADVTGDDALQAWARELADPDAGQLEDFGEESHGSIKTVDYLVNVLTMVVFTASAQHAAVNFGQRENMIFV